MTAAHRLIDEQGDFTTQELISEAGVALKTFYRHFTSKDHLLIALLAERIQGHAEAMHVLGEGVTDPVERLELFVTSPFRVMIEGPIDSDLPLHPGFITSQHWRLHQLYPDEVAAAARPFTDLVRGVIDEGRAEGCFASRDPERDAWLIATLVMAVFHHYAFHPDDPGRVRAGNDVWEFCSASLGVKAGSSGGDSDR